MDFMHISGRILTNLYEKLRIGVCLCNFKSVNKPVTARAVDARLVDICRNPIGFFTGFKICVQFSKDSSLMTMSSAKITCGADSPMAMKILTSCNSVSISCKQDAQKGLSSDSEISFCNSAIPFCNAQCFLKWTNGKCWKNSLPFLCEMAAKRAG